MAWGLSSLQVRKFCWSTYSFNQSWPSRLRSNHQTSEAFGFSSCRTNVGFCTLQRNLSEKSIAPLKRTCLKSFYLQLVPNSEENERIPRMNIIIWAVPTAIKKNIKAPLSDLGLWVINLSKRLLKMRYRKSSKSNNYTGYELLFNPEMKYHKIYMVLRGVKTSSWTKMALLFCSVYKWILLTSPNISISYIQPKLPLRWWLASSWSKQSLSLYAILILLAIL